MVKILAEARWHALVTIGCDALIRNGSISPTGESVRGGIWKRGSNRLELKTGNLFYDVIKEVETI